MVVRPLTAIGGVRNWPNVVSPSSSGDERLHPSRPSVTFVLYSSSEIIALDGYITSNGCRYLVQDLWYHTGSLFDQLQSHHGVPVPLSAEEDDIHSSILDALPRSIHVPRAAWPLLAYTVGMMSTCYAMARAEGSEAALSNEDAVN